MNIHVTCFNVYIILLTLTFYLLIFCCFYNTKENVHIILVHICNFSTCGYLRRAGVAFPILNTLLLVIIQNYVSRGKFWWFFFICKWFSFTCNMQFDWLITLREKYFILYNMPRYGKLSAFNEIENQQNKGVQLLLYILFSLCKIRHTCMQNSVVKIQYNICMIFE